MTRVQLWCVTHSIYVCACVWMLLISWETGQLCKKIEASWWGVVATSWWPRFRTQTHTYKEVDQVYAMRSGRCVGRGGWRENTRRWGAEGWALLLFFMDPYCSAVVTTGWTHAGHLGNRWSGMFWSTDSGKWGTVPTRWTKDEKLGLVFEQTELKFIIYWGLYIPINCPTYFFIFITQSHDYKAEIWVTTVGSMWV